PSPFPSTGSENGCKEEGEEERQESREEAGEARSEEGCEEAQTERRVHETGAAGWNALGGRGRQRDAPHRGDQEALGLHPQERPTGREEPSHDQRRRQPQGGLRRQGSGLDVRDDQARQQASEVAPTLASARGTNSLASSSPCCFFSRKRSRHPRRTNH